MPRQYHLVRGWWGSGAGLWGDVMDGLHVESIILGQLQGASKQPGFFSLVWLHCEVCGILVPWPGIEPLQWKHGVLTTRPPGKSQVGQFQKGRIVCSVFRVKDCDSHPFLTPSPVPAFWGRGLMWNLPSIWPVGTLWGGWGGGLLNFAATTPVLRTLIPNSTQDFQTGAQTFSSPQAWHKSTQGWF